MRPLTAFLLAILGISGERLFRVQLPPGWALKSVVYDGNDVTDRTLDFGTGGELAGILMVLTQRQTTLFRNCSRSGR